MTRAQALPALYQLKQVRSKFGGLSTYSLCRASSALASPLKLQPATLWTLASQESTNNTMSQEKVASLLFQAIALQVIRHGRNAVLVLDDFSAIHAMCRTSSQVLSIFDNIKRLFKERQVIKIIGNHLLPGQLVDLANNIVSNGKDVRKTH